MELIKQNWKVFVQPYLPVASPDGSSTGASNTHLNFESISSSSWTSFHYEETLSQQLHIYRVKQTLTNLSKFVTPSGTTKLCTMNLCLFFSFGSKTNAWSVTVRKLTKVSAWCLWNKRFQEAYLQFLSNHQATMNRNSDEHNIFLELWFWF